VLSSLSLDLLAAQPEGREKLARAFVHIGALSFEPAVRPEDLAEADRLQAAIRRAFAAAIAGATPLRRDLETINSYASDEPPVLVLRPDLSVARSATDPVRAGLAAVARNAIETIARHARDLRTCEGEGCGRFFLDRSRAKGRRWCSMQRCGNRVKVAAFRRRRSDAT
jgi:predicted RNA-binding Zn ribbon-like protein